MTTSLSSPLQARPALVLLLILSMFMPQVSAAEPAINAPNTLTKSETLKKALANSKFKNAAAFGTKIKGHIMITDHTDECWFRNIKLLELPAK